MVKSVMEMIAGNEIIMATLLVLAVFIVVILVGRIVASFIKPALKLGVIVIIAALFYSYKPEACTQIWSYTSGIYNRIAKTVQERFDDYIAGRFK